MKVHEEEPSDAYTIEVNDNTGLFNDGSFPKKIAK